MPRVIYCIHALRFDSYTCSIRFLGVVVWFFLVLILVVVGSFRDYQSQAVDGKDRKTFTRLVDASSIASRQNLNLPAGNLGCSTLLAKHHSPTGFLCSWSVSVEFFSGLLV